MPIATVQPNPFLAAPALRACVDFYRETSLPLNLPVDLTTPALRWSTEDLIAPAGLGGVPYERRLLEPPQLAWGSPDPLTGIAPLEAVTLRVYAGDGVLDNYFAGEFRGKRMTLHLVDLATGEVQANAFLGALAAVSMPGREATITVVGLDAGALAMAFPANRVTLSTFPYAPQDGGPTGGLGGVIAEGIGVGRGLPCRAVRVRDDLGSETRLAFTADAGTDQLLMTAHGLATGDGPFQVSNSGGALPGGLEAGVPYWPITIDADHVKLAATPGDAALELGINLSSNGTGTQTLFGGRPPQPNDEYDFVLGYGNLAIDRLASSTTGFSYLRSAGDYRLLPRTYAPGGRHVTAVRFPLPNVDQATGQKLALLADVRRYPDLDAAVLSEWKWNAGFYDDVGSRDAVPVGTFSTAALVTGAMGVGLGALECPGDGANYPTIPATGLDLQTFTVEALLRPMGGAGTPTLIVGPAWGFGYGWSLTWVPATGVVTFAGILEGGSTLSVASPAGAMPVGRYTLVGVTRDRVAGTTRLYINGTLVASAASNTAWLRYGTFAGILMYDAPGRFDWLRVSGVARTARELRRDYLILRRNPAEWLRDIITNGMGELVDQASLETAATVLDGVEDGALKCDHWLTEPGTVKQAAEDLLVFRDLVPVRSETSGVGARVLAQATQAEAEFGQADGVYGNLVSIDSRLRSSLTEAIRRQPLAYRPVRDETGVVRAYEQRREADALPVGREAEPLALAAVYDHVTADVVRHWVSRQLRVDELLGVTVAHEGRKLRPGQVVRLTIPPNVFGEDYRIRGVTNGVRNANLVLAPYDEQAFLYVPQPMPTDPIVDTRATLDLGSDPRILISLPNPSGRAIRAFLEFRTLERLRPIKDGHATQMPTLVGAAAHWQAVDEVVADEDTSYVEQGPGVRVEQYAVTPIGPNTGRIRDLTVYNRARKTGASNVWIMPALRVAGVDLLNLSAATLISTSYATYGVQYLHNPVSDEPWTPADLVGFEAGAGADVAGATMRLTQSWVEITWIVEAPAGIGFVRWWRLGPSATQPPTPLESGTAFDVKQGLDALETELDGAGTWWLWASVYDALGRFVGIIGPTSVPVS